MKNAGLLLLEDGTFYEGSIFGNPAEAYGEVVFSTSMTGFEESITDPSFRGQILVFSYPLIGNYRFGRETLQSGSPQVRGVVVSENTSPMAGKTSTFEQYLSRNGIPGLQGVDTRSIVRKVRSRGTMKGMIIPGMELSGKLEELAGKRNVWEENLVAEVSTRRVRGPFGKGRKVVIVDCGMKLNLLRDLSARFETYVVPYSTGYEKILSLEPDGVVVSSGPGDPSHPGMQRVLPVLSRLCEDMPVLGICLGHQLVALSQGATTYKLKFGHRGINHPVRLGERVYITSQNHGFAVDEQSVLDTPMRVSQKSLNDGTVEGLVHENGKVFTSQYHPEGGPGPSDTSFMYEMFSRKIYRRD